MCDTIGFIEKVRDEIDRHGMRGLFTKAWHKTSRFFWYTNCSLWYERDLNDPIAPVKRGMDVGIEFLVQDKTRLIKWLKERKSSFPWIYFEKEFETAHDHVFLVITCGGNIIGYVKIGLGRTYVHDFDRTIVFQPKTAFIYDTFILPDYRGKRLASFALEQILLYLKEKKYSKILCHIESWNVPSIRAFERAGFRAGESIRFVRMARVSLFVRNGFRPFISLEKHLRSGAVHKG